MVSGGSEDLSSWALRVGLSVRDLLELLEVFRTHAPRYVTVARQATTQADWRAAARAAHSLKGAAAITGQLDLAALAAELEALLRHLAVAGATSAEATDTTDQPQREVRESLDAQLQAVSVAVDEACAHIRALRHAAE